MALSSDTRKDNNAAENNKAAAEKAIADALGRSNLYTQSRNTKLNFKTSLSYVRVLACAVLIQYMLCMKTVRIFCAHAFMPRAFSIVFSLHLCTRRHVCS